MVTVAFTQGPTFFTGFCITGHADAADAGEDIVCAAVSSAAYCCANTLTDVVGSAAAQVDDAGKMQLQVTTPGDTTEQILQGLLLHMQQLEFQYPNNVKTVIRRCSAC